MKARAAFVSASVLLGLTAVASPAAAAPPGLGLQTFGAQCPEGGPTVTVTTGGGASFWLAGQHYLLTSIEARFDPVQGETETFTKTYGNRTGLQGSEITCHAEIVEPGQGTATFDVTAVAVP